MARSCLGCGRLSLNPEKELDGGRCAGCRTERREESIYHTARWRRLCERVKKRARGRCEICGKEGGRMIVHHLDPIEEGGDAYPPIELLLHIHLAEHSAYEADRRAGRDSALRRAVESRIPTRGAVDASADRPPTIA